MMITSSVVYSFNSSYPCVVSECFLGFSTVIAAQEVMGRMINKKTFCSHLAFLSSFAVFNLTVIVFAALQEFASLLARWLAAKGPKILLRGSLFPAGWIDKFG